MNLQELSGVSTILFAGVVGGAAAHDAGSGFTSVLYTIGGALVGLLIGSAVVWVVHSLAYEPLDRAFGRASRTAEIGWSALLLFLPILSIGAGIAITHIVITSIAHLVP